MEMNDVDAWFEKNGSRHFRSFHLFTYKIKCNEEGTGEAFLLLMLNVYVHQLPIIMHYRKWCYFAEASDCGQWGPECGDGWVLMGEPQSPWPLTQGCLGLFFTLLKSWWESALWAPAAPWGLNINSRAQVIYYVMSLQQQQNSSVDLMLCFVSVNDPKRISLRLKCFRELID